MDEPAFFGRIRAAFPDLIELTPDETLRLTAYLKHLPRQRVSYERQYREKRAGLDTYQKQLDAEKEWRCHLRSVCQYNETRHAGQATERGEGAGAVRDQTGTESGEGAAVVRTIPFVPDPGYPKPPAERLHFAANQLAEVEQFIAPGSLVFTSLLVRALLARHCTVAEALWAIDRHVEAGRYKATLLKDLPATAGAVISEHDPPTGLEVATNGRVHIDVDDKGEVWSMVVITLPSAAGDGVQPNAAGQIVQLSPAELEKALAVLRSIAGEPLPPLRWSARLEYHDRYGTRKSALCDGDFCYFLEPAGVPWLPDGWCLRLAPLGLTAEHLRQWFDHAINMATARPRFDYTPDMDTARWLVDHARLLVRHVGGAAAADPHNPIREAYDAEQELKRLKAVLGEHSRFANPDLDKGALPVDCGRKPLSDAEARERESLIAGWERFRGSGSGSKKDFCKDRKISIQRLNAALAWQRTRRNRKARANK